MAITRLKRKDRKNKARANNKQTVIKQLLRTPVIKNVDVDALKAQFGTSATSKATSTVKNAISSAASTVAHKVEGVVEAVKEKVDSALHSNEEKSAE